MIFTDTESQTAYHQATQELAMAGLKELQTQIQIINTIQTKIAEILKAPETNTADLKYYLEALKLATEAYNNLHGK